mgnify:FL=1
MKDYKVKIAYTFTGTVTVNADSKAHAKEIVNRDWGMVAGGISCSNESTAKDEEGVIDWDISTHADIVKIR